MSSWTIFSNHGHVLLFLANNPDARLRDVAERVGITERAVQKIIRDMQDDGVISVHKHGRRNQYRIHTRKPLRHPLEAHRTVGQLVRLIHAPEEVPERPPADSPPDEHAAPSPAEQPVPEQPAPVTPATETVAAETAGPAPAESAPQSSQDESAPPEPARKKTRDDNQQGSLF